jgi:hypothetical protein
MSILLDFKADLLCIEDYIHYNSKSMKLLYFTILSVFPFTASSMDFQNCIDKNGVSHYTNLPVISLKSDCSVVDYHNLKLIQDFQNLSHGYTKLNKVVKLEASSSTKTISKDNDTKIQSAIQNKITDLLDADKALDELLSNSEKHDDSIIMERFKARSTAVEDIINQ